MTYSEIDRIKKTYKKRDKIGISKLYSFLNKSTIFIYHQREKAMLEALSSQDIKDLSYKRILDVGCGSGGY